MTTLKPYAKKLSRLDLKALEVWDRIKDPDYYGLKPVPTASPIFSVADDEDDPRLVMRVGTKCRCGKCITCRRRVEGRRHRRRTQIYDKAQTD